MEFITVTFNSYFLIHIYYSARVMSIVSNVLIFWFSDALAVTQYLKSKNLYGVSGFVSLLFCYICM